MSCNFSITFNKGKRFATQALSQTQKNVSEPQMGILVAQWLERLTEDQKVVGSIPIWAQKHFSEFAIKLE